MSSPTSLSQSSSASTANKSASPATATAMTPATAHIDLGIVDLSTIPLTAGIEIHQQLDGQKLFCHTPCIIRDDACHYTIKRKLKSVVGETGVIDAAALAEEQKDKWFIYESYTDTIGLVELDEEPPHLLNSSALYCATQMAKLVSCTLVDEVQVMRKTVVDGSNTSGFQRTALLGMDGHITDSSGAVISIPTVVLEEDASKKVSDTPDTVTYNLSRLGIPLIEISTGPDLNSPKQVAEVAEKLGLLLRSLPTVKRGLGTIRQDVNVSIPGGKRVEIKGAQDLKSLPQLVEYEMIRQAHCLLLSSYLTSKKVEIGSVVDVTSLFSQSSSEFLKKCFSKNSSVGCYAVALKNGAGLLGTHIQPGKRIGTELSDYAKVHSGIGGMIHADEQVSTYGFSAQEVANVRFLLELTESDSWIMIVSDKLTSHKAFASLSQRLSAIAQFGVVSEVRRANPDCTTTYMRPMPGQARMYPETDCLPVLVPTIVELPQTIEQKIDYYVSLGLAQDRAKSLAKSELRSFVDKCIVDFPQVKVSTFVETIFGSIYSDVQKKVGSQISISQAIYIELFNLANQGKVLPSLFSSLLSDHIKTGKPLADLLTNYAPLSDEELTAIISVVKRECGPQAPPGLLMGKIMARTNGRADGAVVKRILGI
jgi:glutamyl-tRNA(Gln) amidotransferase subunit E